MSSSARILVVFTGLPATGKSSVARRLLGSATGVHLSTDETRERLFPRGGVGAATKYSDEASRRTYEAVEAEALRQLELGVGLVILDGTYLRPIDRRRAVGLGRAAGAEVLLLELGASPAAIEARLEARVPGAEHHSEADLQVYRQLVEKLGQAGSGFARVTAGDLEEWRDQPVVGASLDTDRGVLELWFGAPSAALRQLLESLGSGLGR